MIVTEKKCPKCNDNMVKGFVPDYSYGTVLVPSWYEGPPKNTSCGELQYQTRMGSLLQLLDVLVVDLSSSMLRKNLKQCNTVLKPVLSKRLGGDPGEGERISLGRHWMSDRQNKMNNRKALKKEHLIIWAALLLTGIFIWLCSATMRVTSPSELFQKGMSEIIAGVFILAGGVVLLLSSIFSKNAPKSSVLNCPKCGTAVPSKDDKFCRVCGAYL